MENYLDTLKGTIPPAQLWVGKHAELLGKVVHYLQKIFCSNGGCAYCSVCHKIIDQQFYGITWILPEKAYTLEHLEPIDSTIKFVLEKKSCHFFILQKADSLGIVSGNSLLKSIEEPPLGYHFLLIAEHQEDILATIRSRCIVFNFYSNKQYIKHQGLFSLLTCNDNQLSSTFLKELEVANMSEHDALLLLDQLFFYWTQKAKRMLEMNNIFDYEKALINIEKIQRFLSKPLMNGSANIVFKDLFLQMW